MSDNKDYPTLSGEIGITPHNMFWGVMLPAIGEILKKMSDNFGRRKNRPKAEGIKQ